jgi:hypothetical protein
VSRQADELVEPEFVLKVPARHAVWEVAAVEST